MTNSDAGPRQNLAVDIRVTTAAHPSHLSPAQLGLLAAFAFFLLVGGSRAGWLTPIRLLDAILGAIVVALWLRAMTRGADLADRLTLGALLLFLLTCLTSTLPRFSFDSATTVLTYTALYGLARREFRSEQVRAVMARFLAATATVFVAIVAVVWGGQWLEWLQASGGQLPPLELTLSNLGIYTFKYPIAIFIAMLLPLVAALPGDPRIRRLGYPVIAAGLLLIVMSGARSAWTGSLAGAFVMAARPIRLRVPRMSRRAAVAAVFAGAVTLAVLVIVGSVLAHRAFNSSTVSLRINIWGYALSELGGRPLVGSGPGTFPSLITLSGYFQDFDSVARGPDSSPVQILAEQGVAGVAAVVLLSAALFVALRRNRNIWTRPALASAAVFVVSSLTNDTIHVAQLVGLACIVAALAGPSGPITPVPSGNAAPSLRRVATYATAIVLAGAVGATQTAAILHARAAGASSDGDNSTALQDAETAAALDPANGYYLHQLGLARLAVGDREGALSAFERASSVSPADLAALRSAALVAADLGNYAEAKRLAQRAATLRPSDVTEDLVLALVDLRAGSPSQASSALEVALQWAPWLPGAPEWASAYPSDGQLAALLRTAARSSAATADPRRAVQRTWLASATGNATSSSDATLSGIASSSPATCTLRDKISPLHPQKSRALRKSSCLQWWRISPEIRPPSTAFRSWPPLVPRAPNGS